MHDVRLPGRARPLLHERELLSRKLRERREEEFDVLILQRQYLLVKVEEERVLTIHERQDGTHDPLACRL